MNKRILSMIVAFRNRKPSVEEAKAHIPIIVVKKVTTILKIEPVNKRAGSYAKIKGMIKQASAILTPEKAVPIGLAPEIAAAAKEPNAKGGVIFPITPK